jgi:hypothetical protein
MTSTTAARAAMFALALPRFATLENVSKRPAKV